LSSYAIDDGEHLLLFDLLAVPSEIVELAADREPTDRPALERALA
jgi:hypothetical protein